MAITLRWIIFVSNRSLKFELAMHTYWLYEYIVKRFTYVLSIWQGQPKSSESNKRLNFDLSFIHTIYFKNILLSVVFSSSATLDVRRDMLLQLRLFIR